MKAEDLIFRLQGSTCHISKSNTNDKEEELKIHALKKDVQTTTNHTIEANKLSTFWLDNEVVYDTTVRSRGSSRMANHSTVLIDWRKKTQKGFY